MKRIKLISTVLFILFSFTLMSCDSQRNLDNNDFEDESNSNYNGFGLEIIQDAYNNLQQDFMINNYTGKDKDVVVPLSLSSNGEVTEIEDGAFANNKSITSLTIHPSLLYKHGYSDDGKYDIFTGCSNLIEFKMYSQFIFSCNVIEGNLYEYESYFDETYKLIMVAPGKKKINIQSKVKSFYEKAFLYADLTEITVDVDNAYFISIDGNLFSKDGKTLIRLANKYTSYVIPEGVTNINRFAFANCTQLTSLTFPSTFKINSGYFSNYFPNLFKNCKNLKNLLVDSKSAYFTSKNGDIYDKNSEILYLMAPGKTTFEITSGITVANNAFNFSMLQEVTFDFGAYLINSSIHELFAYCQELEKIKGKFEGIVTEAIDGNLYNNSGGLLAIASKSKSLILTNYSGLFLTYHHIKNITEITVADYCPIDFLKTLKKVTSINVLPTSTYLKSIDGNIYSYDEKTFIVSAPGKKVVNVKYGVTKIESDAFYDSFNQEITIPKTVESLSGGQFIYCSKLKNVKIETSIPKIELCTFFGCINLQKVSIPNSVTIVERYAFGHCYQLEEIDLPTELIEIASMAFHSCISLKSIFLPNKVERISQYCFNDAINLKKIEIDKNNPYFIIKDFDLYDKQTNAKLFTFVLSDY